MKPPLRTKSVGTKVSEAEFALLEERARGVGLTLGEWVRDVLLAEPEVAGEVVLAELLALRTLFLNLRPLPGHGLPSEEEVRAEVTRVDGAKRRRARELLEKARAEGR
jgi:hypothetical protein